MLTSARTPDLAGFLDQIVAAKPHLTDAAKVVVEIAQGAIELSDLVSRGLLTGRLDAELDSANYDGDIQKELDVFANDLFINVLQRAGVAHVVSEELQEPLVLNPGGPLSVAIDPLDGSSNIDANVSIGTIFSILPSLAEADDLRAHFLQPGRNQIGSGYVIYGPQTSLVFTLGSGTEIFTLDRREGRFRLAASNVQIPRDSIEYAINASNYPHWELPVRAFIDDCVLGTDGPLKRNHNMRWIASLVAENYRILMRGGVFLYPRDQRTRYGEGRLRLVYEANPIAFLVEQAGGAATDGSDLILDIVPAGIHARVPLVFGSADSVELIQQYHSDPQFSAEHAPLFGRRGLMRL